MPMVRSKYKSSGKVSTVSLDVVRRPVSIENHNVVVTSGPLVSSSSASSASKLSSQSNLTPLCFPISNHFRSVLRQPETSPE